MGVELMDSSVFWYAVLAVVVVALVFVLFNFNKVKKMKEGNDEMVEMAGIIRSGAGTFLKAEFKVIAIIGVIIALVFSLFVEATSGITFLLGGLMSSLVCIIGMKSATYANVRTANKARESLSIGETVKVALSGGSVSGIAVQAFGMLGLLLVLIIWGVDPHATGHGLVANLECNPSIMRITTYSLGCSIVAMFNRVAGGNYTKAADISSDILAKIRHDMPEDDSRADPTKEGYTFKGWNTKADGTGETVTAETVVTDDLEVYAVFEQNPAPIEEVKVVIDVDGVKTEVKVIKGEAIGSNLPADPTKEGYTFKGWNTKADGTGETVTADTVVSDELEVYAIFAKTETPKDPEKGDDTKKPTPSPTPTTTPTNTNTTKKNNTTTGTTTPASKTTTTAQTAKTVKTADATPLASTAAAGGLSLLGMLAALFGKKKK